MRIAATDKGAANFDKIFLDGKEIEYVTEMDTKAGWLTRLVHRDGKAVVRNGVIQEETLRGKITFLLNTGEDDADIYPDS